MVNIQRLLGEEFKLSQSQVVAVIALIEDGNTIPFIARYRKEATGGIDDVTLRNFDERLSYLKKLEHRKEEVIRLIDELGKLTPKLKDQIESATVMQRVEDLYKPYRKKRTTRASKARDAGLGALSDIILAQNLTNGDPLKLSGEYVNVEAGYKSPEDALQGALDIIAETIADDAGNTEDLRDFTWRCGDIISTAVDPNEKTVYETYYNFSIPALRITNHSVLALNRGEKEEKLIVKLSVDTVAAISQLKRRVIFRDSIFSKLLAATVEDSYKRLMAPSLEREVRGRLTERAELDAIKVFAKNTESLLLQRPVKDARIIAIDPGYRTGCKVAVLDEHGKLLNYTTVYPTPPNRDVAGTMQVLDRYAREYKINIIVIGNGTGSRETEAVVSEYIERSGRDIQYTIVSEAGASVYSASKLASEEYPDLDVTTRGAMSLGRRLIDPLAELVKIPPKSIGVGQYQHDLNQAALNTALTHVVENAVNRVGVDLNTASASLLGYVAGIGPVIAKNITQYRESAGAFKNRRELKKVPKLGEKAFGQCAGFLRISGGTNPLDATSVHPESYEVALKLLKLAGLRPEEIGSVDKRVIRERLGDLETLSKQLDVGVFTLRDIVAEFEKPGRDPRDNAPPVVFSKSVKSFGDLYIGLELTGTVRNVVDFGAFVDIGLKNDGLVHVSKMSNRFIKHPSELVSVGDTVKVRVISVEEERGKIGLSMVPVKRAGD